MEHLNVHSSVCPNIILSIEDKGDRIDAVWRMAVAQELHPILEHSFLGKTVEPFRKIVDRMRKGVDVRAMSYGDNFHIVPEIECRAKVRGTEGTG